MMKENETIRVALVRGDSLNPWEGKLWESLPVPYSVTGFCSRRNLYSLEDLGLPIERLRSTTDIGEVNRIAMYGGGVFQKMFGLEKKLTGFNIAHTAEIYNYYTLQAVRAKKLNPNLKVVATVWDNSFGRFERNYWPLLKTPSWWRKKISSVINYNARGVDKFLAVSEYSAELLRDIGVEEKKIRVLQPAIVEIALPPGVEILKKFNLKDKNFYLMVNRLTEEKGVYDCLYAWKLFMRGNNSDRVLVIVGDGPERQNILRLIKEWGMEESVRYLSRLPNEDVRQLYPFARALLLASLPTPVWQEQFGYVLAEALASGCPVIGTYSGSIPDVVGRGGILVAPGNPVELYKAIIGLDKIDSGMLAVEFEKTKARFSAARFQNELLDIYSRLIY